MGRRHLIRVATAAVAFALLQAAPAGAAVHWRLLAGGPAAGAVAPAPGAAPSGFVAFSRAATAPFAARLPAPAAAKLARVDFTRDGVIAIFGQFGCQDSSIVVSGIEQHGLRLAVALLEQPPKPGTVQCLAIFATYRLLLVARTQLVRPLPTRAQVSLARP